MFPSYLARLLTEQPEWQEEAVCATVDPDLWYPEKGDAGAAAQAKRLCVDCPVRAQCLQDALDHDERFGVWGGLTERERRRLRPAGERPRNVADPDLIRLALAMVASGSSVREAAREIGVDKSTVFRALKAAATIEKEMAA